MTFEAQTTKNKLLDDIAQIDAALAKGDSVLTDTYNKLKSEKEIEIVLIDKILKPVYQVDKTEISLEPLVATGESITIDTVDKNQFPECVVEYPCNICRKICKSNAGLVGHQKKCKVDNVTT
jgi:hypothetical protein